MHRAGVFATRPPPAVVVVVGIRRDFLCAGNAHGRYGRWIQKSVGSSGELIATAERTEEVPLTTVLVRARSLQRSDAHSAHRIINSFCASFMANCLVTVFLISRHGLPR